MKCIGWMPGELCNFDLAHDLHIDFSSKSNSLISWIVGQIDAKQKRRESVRHWAHCITLPYHHTHELDL